MEKEEEMYIYQFLHLKDVLKFQANLKASVAYSIMDVHLHARSAAGWLVAMLILEKEVCSCSRYSIN